MNSYLPTPRCAECRGACCKYGAGAYHPRDIGNLSMDQLAAQFHTGDFAIDHCSGDIITGSFYNRRNGRYWPTFLYFLRPRQVGDRSERVLTPSCGGECGHLTEKGCNLSFYERPTECRSLRPSLIKCGSTKGNANGRALAVRAWLPYTRMLLEAALVINKDDTFLMRAYNLSRLSQWPYASSHISSVKEHEMVK